MYDAEVVYRSVSARYRRVDSFMSKSISKVGNGKAF
jgi:hypothetical protein